MMNTTGVMPQEISNWERILKETKDCNCPFCGAKCISSQGNYPIWRCVNNNLHKKEGEIWGWYKADNISLGLKAVNIRFYNSYKEYYQFCYREKNFSIDSQNGILIKNIGFFSLNNSKQNHLDYVKTLLVFR